MTRHNALPNVGGFTDLNEYGFLRFPNILVKAADILDEEIILATDLYRNGLTRNVHYIDSDGTVYYYEMVPYTHPTGAAAVVLGTTATAADGTVTYTPTLQGRLIGEDGVLGGSLEDAEDVAGMLLTDYYEHFHDNDKQREHFRVTQLEEGDFCWLVRRGRVKLDSAAATTAGQYAVTAASGEVTPAAAIDTTSTTTLANTLVQNTFGPGKKGVAQFLETIGAAGLALADLHLPRKYGSL